jgi:hypothetical protein
MTAAQDLNAEIHAAWAVMEAPAPQDMAVMDWEYGEDAKKAFVGVRPIDVDIGSAGFAAATPLLELPAHAAAAYLGPYLLSLIKGFQIEEAVGFPVDIKTRSYTLFAMSSPTFWTDIAGPHLNDACVSVLGKVARFVVQNDEVFQLSEEERRGLERLGRSAVRRLNPSGNA